MDMRAVANLRKETQTQIKTIADIIDATGVTLDVMGTRFEAIEDRLKDLDHEVDGRLETNQYDADVEETERDITNLGDRVDVVEKDMDEHGDRIEAAERSIEDYGSRLDVTEKEVDDHEERLDDQWEAIETMATRFNVFNRMTFWQRLRWLILGRNEG